MKRIVKYTAIDPLYSDVVQVYIGINSEEIDAIQYETEKSMGRYHSNGINSIYKSEVVTDESDLTKCFSCERYKMFTNNIWGHAYHYCHYGNNQYFPCRPNDVCGYKSKN